MILMRMGKDRGADRSTLDLFQHRGRIMADMLGMHATVEDHGTLWKVESVAVGPDPCSSREIRETHKGGVYERGFTTREGNLAPHIF